MQFDIAWEDKPANFGAVDAQLDRAGVPSGSLVALPEMFATGFSFNVDRIAEGDDRLVETWLADTARSRRVTMVGGVVNRAADGRGLNQALAVSPEGNEAARYTKLHPFTFSGENESFAPGDGVVTFDWRGVTVAPLVCYDLRFPEPFRAAARMGAELFVVIANWPAARHHHWRHLLIARAIENQAYVMGVNRTGSDPKNDYAGGSIIIDPRGEMVVEADDSPQALTAPIDIAALRDYRTSFPVLPDMRDDL